MKRLSLGIVSAAFALFLGSSLIVAPPARADRLVLKNGRTVEGRIVKETPEEVEIEFQRFGVTAKSSFPRTEIKEVIKEEAPVERYQRAIAESKSSSDLVEIGKKAIGDGFPKIATSAFEKAIKLDPEHAGAREALGFKKVGGKWLPEREWKIKEGWKEDPKTHELVSPEEWVRREAERKAEANKAAEEYKKELAGAGAWIVKETPHYFIRCNSTEKIAQRYADFMEKIYAEYDKVFKKYKRYWQGKSTIYVFRSNEDFQAFAEGQQGVGGFYRPKSSNTAAYPDRIVASFHGAFGTGDTREVLAHECTHQIEHILCDGDETDFLMRPTWWMEGFATYFGDGCKFDRKGNLGVQIPRMRLNPIQQYIKSGQVPDKFPLSRFVRVPLPQYQMMAGLTYPYGWSLIYYFKKRGEVPGKKKGTFEVKPVKITIDGKEREVDLAKVLDDFFQAVTLKPPKSDMNPMTGYADYYGKKLDEILGFPVDQLADDWKQFILGLEPPSLGSLDKYKKKYIGSEVGFEVAGPGLKGWNWKEEDCVGDEAIRLENTESTGLVRIEVDGNMENDPLETLKDSVSNALGRLYTGLAIDLDQAATVANIESGWEFLYTGTEQAIMPGQTVRSSEQKVWHLLIGGATLKRTYQIICTADKDRFDENKPAFEKIVNSFKLLKED